MLNNVGDAEWVRHRAVERAIHLNLSRRSLAKTDGRRARFVQRSGYNPKREHDVQGRRRVDGKPEG